MNSGKINVSGYTRNETFIKGSIQTLKEDVNSNQDRIGKLEGQIEILMKSSGNASGGEADPHVQIWDMKTKIILAVIGFLTTVATAIIALL